MIDARLHHRPDPAYLRGLIERAGISQREAARRLGVTDSHLRKWLREPPASVCPYPAQVCLELLAGETT